MASREILLKHRSDHVTQVSSVASSQEKQSPQSASTALEIWASVSSLFPSPLHFAPSVFHTLTSFLLLGYSKPTLASLPFHLTVPSACTIHFPDMHLAPSHNLKFPLKFYLPQKALIDHLVSDHSLLLPANNLHLLSLLAVFLQHLPDILFYPFI